MQTFSKIKFILSVQVGWWKNVGRISSKQFNNKIFSQMISSGSSDIVQLPHTVSLHTEKMTQPSAHAQEPHCRVHPQTGPWSSGLFLIKIIICQVKRWACVGAILKLFFLFLYWKIIHKLALIKVPKHTQGLAVGAHAQKPLKLLFNMPIAVFP